MKRSTWLVAGGLTVGIVATGIAGIRLATADSGLPAVRQAVLNQRAAEQAAAQASVRASKPSKAQGLADAAAAQAAAPAPVAPAAGIVATNEGPFPRILFLVNNAWQGPVTASGATRWYLVYAGGAEATDGTTGNVPTGGLRIYSQANAIPDGTADYLAVFNAPAGTGPLTVTSFTGPVLTLSAANGSTLTFDLGTRSFS